MEEMEEKERRRNVCNSAELKPSRAWCHFGKVSYKEQENRDRNNTKMHSYLPLLLPKVFLGSSLGTFLKFTQRSHCRVTSSCSSDLTTATTDHSSHPAPLFSKVTFDFAVLSDISSVVPLLPQCLWGWVGFLLYARVVIFLTHLVWSLTITPSGNQQSRFPNVCGRELDTPALLHSH